MKTDLIDQNTLSLNKCPHGFKYEGQCKLCSPPDVVERIGAEIVAFCREYKNENSAVYVRHMELARRIAAMQGIPAEGSLCPTHDSASGEIPVSLRPSKISDNEVIYKIIDQAFRRKGRMNVDTWELALEISKLRTMESDTQNIWNKWNSPKPVSGKDTNSPVSIHSDEQCIQTHQPDDCLNAFEQWVAKWPQELTHEQKTDMWWGFDAAWKLRQTKRVSR